MTRRNQKVNRAKTRRCGVSVTKSTSTKGRRAKRGRRKEFTELLLHFARIDKREMTAIEALQSLNANDVEENAEQTPTVPPSSLEELREGVQRFAAFVRSPNERVAVQFRIQQVAHALQISETILKFIVDVLVPLEVVKREECDAWLWKGTERAKEICSCSLQHQPDRNQLTSDASKSHLMDFSVRLLNALVTAKEPLCTKRLLDEMKIIRCPEETADLQQLIHCVCAVLVGIDIIATMQLNSEQIYGLPSVVDAKMHPVVGPERHAETQTTPSCAQQAPPGTGTLFSVPIVVDDKMAVLELIPDAASHRIAANARSVNLSSVPVRNKAIGVTQAAVMEIVGNEVTQVGTIDVLGQGSLTTHFDHHSGTNSVIAVAVPEWMLTYKGPHLAHSVQIYAFDTPLLSINPLTLETHQPMKISCISVPQGSLLEVLSHTLTAKRATSLAFKKPDCIKQASHAVRF